VEYLLDILKDERNKILIERLLLIIFLFISITLYFKNSTLKTKIAYEKNQYLMTQAKLDQMRLMVNTKNTYDYEDNEVTNDNNSTKRIQAKHKNTQIQKKISVNKNPNNQVVETKLEDDATITLKEAFNFLKYHNYISSELFDTNKDIIIEQLESLYFNSEFDQTSTKLDAAVMLSEISDTPYLNPVITESLIDQLDKDTYSSYDIMAIIYNAGIHPKNIDKMIPLLDNESDDISELSTMTLFEFIVDKENDNEFTEYSKQIEIARKKVAKQLVKNPEAFNYFLDKND